MLLGYQLFITDIYPKRQIIYLYVKIVFIPYTNFKNFYFTRNSLPPCSSIRYSRSLLSTSTPPAATAIITHVAAVVGPSCSCRYSCNCCFFNISILFRDHISSHGSSNCKTSYTQCPCNFSSPFHLYKKIFYSAFYFYIVYIIFDCLRKFLLVFYNAPHNLLRFQEIIHKKQLLQHILITVDLYQA